MPLKSVLLLSTGIAIGLGLNLTTAQDAQKKLTIADFPNLTAGIKETPGCLDVRVGTVGKQQTIFAWFKDKAAVQAWYSSPMHVAAMKKFFPAMPAGNEVLPKYKNTDGPFLVVATVTPGDKPILPDSPLHVSQIAIEMYSPLSGGIAIGGSFGPKSLGNAGPAWLGEKH